MKLSVLIPVKPNSDVEFYETLISKFTKSFGSNINHLKN